MRLEGHIDASSHDLCLKISDWSVELIIAEPRDETLTHRLVVPPERLEIRFKDAFHSIARLSQVLSVLSDKVRQEGQP